MGVEVAGLLPRKTLKFIFEMVHSSPNLEFINEPTDTSQFLLAITEPCTFPCQGSLFSGLKRLKIKGLYRATYVGVRKESRQ